MLRISQTVPAMQGTQGKGAGEQHSRSRQKGCEHTTDPAQRSAENPPVQTGCATATDKPFPFLILDRAQALQSQPSSGPDDSWKNSTTQKQMSYKVGMWFISVPGACGIAPKGIRNNSLTRVLF